MQFLSGADIQANVKQLASRSDGVMAAVAYWGEGAAEQTGLADNDRPEGVRVICDLLSGACNPYEVERLQHLGVVVRTLDRLHAKVWINGNDVIVGSANASHNGLPGDDEEAANASIEAAVRSQDPRLARRLAAWFDDQWCASSTIEQRHLVQARDLWRRRHRSGGRGFTKSLTETLRNPDLLDRFAGLRLLAYPEAEVNAEAKRIVTRDAGLYFTEEEWNEFGDERPWYESCLSGPKWARPSGTVYADFACPPEDVDFTFNGFWQIRNCPEIELEEEGLRLTLLTKLPHFHGYSLSPKEQKAIAKRIRTVVEERNHGMDKFGSYIDENFLEFWDAERPELRQRLLAQVVQAARELCRAGRFDPALTLFAIRECTKDPEWLAGYARFVGGDIYGNRNPLKPRINPHFGKQVMAGVGAAVQKDDNGNPARRQVEGEVIRSYTLFECYDPQVIESS